MQVFFEADKDRPEQMIPGVMNVLSSAMNLLRRCRVNAALTIQLFSQLFHFVNMWTFNQIVTSGYPRPGEPPFNFCTHRYFKLLPICRDALKGRSKVV